MFVFSSYPIITAFLGTILLHEALNKKNYVALLLLVVALTLMFNPANIARYLIGNLLSFFVGLTWAFYVVGSKVLSRNGNSPIIIGFLSVWIAVITSGIGFVLFEPLHFHLSMVTLLEVIVFGFLNFTGFTLLNTGFKYVKVSTGAMLLLLEPIAGSILGFLFFKEIPTVLFICGAILIIVSIYISTTAETQT